MNVQEDFNKFIKDAKRVLKVSRKPDGNEYLDLAKISALGVVVVGGIGYLIVCLGYLIGL
ncbi:MAG: protein translocase SEC61 complex subunit gamma [Methanobrevibacter thaueri]|jgi:protein transport protein SEC61 subunit gamma-like protein|uniref:Protein translocase subunit SecE n=1 Tax=Methanobrevibacter thaueri TaxID=190975 RepID=A0A8T3VI40_9EURY|nr:protein translocase SEC61 complex subunit gamma [Methanobrevibacter thaueri]MBE6502358.1 protein translocase SEC61 complex subunit gamma [Methanobrevibacter thaueri]